MQKQSLTRNAGSLVSSLFLLSKTGFFEKFFFSFKFYSGIVFTSCCSTSLNKSKNSDREAVRGDLGGLYPASRY